MSLRPLYPLALYLVLSVYSLIAFASDGVLEINQACAVNTGCVPGDPPGFPVTLPNPGNYRLTSDLVVSSANTTAVQVNAGPSTLDLAGFSIRGVVSCSGVPTSSCTPAGNGIAVFGGDFVTVRNGNVTGMGSDGIRLRYGGSVESVLAWMNGGSGINVADQAIVRSCRATSNGAYGIQGTIEATIDRNSCVGNRLSGIQVESGVVSGNTATRNGSGANLGPTAVFVDNLLGHDAANSASASVSGGRATGGNSCDDDRCTRTGQKRYYLSQNLGNGASAISVCASGFHMASLWEISDSSVLEYDKNLGSTLPDSGSGPPLASIGGWVRTGYYANNGTSGSSAGSVNCAAWTTTEGQGTLVRPTVDWSNQFASPTSISPWFPYTDSCSATNPVWCIEN